jgi:drug/metabolite transporter (DMT)-like permease
MRGLIAGIFCLGFLLWTRSPLPTFRTLAQLSLVSVVGAAGFSVFLALGLQTVSASHATVFLAMLPLATAVLSQLLLRENTPALFWVGAVGGALVSVVYMVGRSHGELASGDVFLLLSVLFASWGYVQAAKFTRVMGGARTMSWVVVLGSPLFLTLLLLGQPDWSVPVSAKSIAALLYLGMISQSLGMFLWCWSLSTGYASIVSQTQTLQPFLSFFGAAVLLGEPLEADIFLVTAVVMGCMVFSTWAKLRSKKNPEIFCSGKRTGDVVLKA